MTLNPIKHIDPIGTILVPLAIVLLQTAGGRLHVRLGQAGAGRISANLRHPKRDMIWVAAAGPGVNFVMAILWAMVPAA